MLLHCFDTFIINEPKISAQINQKFVQIFYAFFQGVRQNQKAREALLLFQLTPLVLIRYTIFCIQSASLRTYLLYDLTFLGNLCASAESDCATSSEQVEWSQLGIGPQRYSGGVLHHVLFKT